MYWNGRQIWFCYVIILRCESVVFVLFHFSIETLWVIYVLWKDISIMYISKYCFHHPMFMYDKCVVWKKWENLEGDDGDTTQAQNGHNRKGKILLIVKIC